MEIQKDNGMKEDEEMKQENTEDMLIEKYNEDIDDKNEEPPNPDLEWETTAIAEEARKQAEIKKSEAPYENPLLVHLYTECKLVERVVNAWEENEGEELRRKGYMGHLTRIANIMQHHANICSMS